MKPALFIALFAMAISPNVAQAADSTACSISPEALASQTDETSLQIQSILKRNGWNELAADSAKTQAAWKLYRDLSATEAGRAQSSDKKTINKAVYNEWYLQITVERVKELDAELASLSEKRKAEQGAAANP